MQQAKRIDGPGRGPFVAFVALSGTVLLWALPYTGASTWPIISQFVAVDKWVAVAGLAATVAAGICLLVGRSSAWAAVMAVGVVTVGLFGGRVAVQGISDGTLPPHESALVAVAWNSGDADPEDVAAQLSPLVTSVDADIVVLPETGWKSGEIAGESLRQEGYNGVTYAPESTATSVVLKESLATSGRYRLDNETPPWAGLALVPERTTPETPVIIATHLQQPSAGSVMTWQEHLQWVRGWCETTPYVLVLGDMNTTVNHLQGSRGLGCTDIASLHNAGASATWPTWLPSWAGMSIDRGMIGRGYSDGDTSFYVARDVTAAGADHWPIVMSIGGAGARAETHR